MLCLETTEYYYDGSYIVTRIYSSENHYKDRNTYTKSGTTDVTKYSSNNTIVWNYSLTGYFEINQGISVVCYNAQHQQYINDSAWSFSNGFSYFQNNTAYGEGTYKKYFLFIVVETVNINTSVSCDEYGNIYH